LIYKYTKNACENFFNNILGLEAEDCKTHRYKNFFYSKISIYTNDIKYDLLFFLKKETINLISDILLFEKNPDEQIRIDLLKEVANLIGGTAKTLMEELDEETEYTLSTPEYLGTIEDIKTLNLYQKFAKKVNNRCFVIAIEEE